MGVKYITTVRAETTFNQLGEKKKMRNAQRNNQGKLLVENEKIIKTINNLGEGKVNWGLSSG